MKTLLQGSIKNYIPLLFVLLLPFSWVSVAVGSAYRLFFIVLFALYIIICRGKLRFNYETTDVMLAWTIYCLYTCVSIVWADWGETSVNVILGMIALYGIGITFFTTRLDSRLEKKLDYCWIIGGFLFIILFLFGETAKVGLGTRQTLVILGTSTDANEFASYFAIAIPLSINMFFKEKRIILRVLHVLLILGGMYVVLSSGSRGALLAVIIASLVTLCVLVRFSLKKIFVFLFFAVLVIVITRNCLIPLIPEGTIERFSIGALIDDSGSGRIEIWTNGFKQFLKGNVFRCIFGYGYDGLIVHTGMSYMMQTSTMHNQFMQQLVSYGIIGLILYIRLMFLVFVGFCKNKRQYIGAFVGMLVMGMTITMGPSYKILWILLFQVGISNLDMRSEMINAYEKI